MNCYECNGTYQEKTDTIEINDPYVGIITITGIPYYRCDNCNDLLFTKEMAQAVEKERNNIITRIINQFPISNFISAAETASILDISRQALHKNRRINHGFIYQTTFSGVKVYLKHSVLLFKKNGDGRFPLCSHVYVPSPEYVMATKIKKIPSVYKYFQSAYLAKNLEFQNISRSPKENIYVN